MSAPGLLDGIRVVDMTQYLAGPTVTRLLAEMGADIVKIERPPYGDPARAYAMLRDGRSAYFVQQNRGKQSLCLDTDHPDGRAILDRLLADADIFVENTGPGVLERRGLDYASLAPTHPRLIMASVSGFGRSGPNADRTAFDAVAQAYSGIAYVTGEPDRPPMLVGTSIGDVMGGVHAAAAIGYALFHRERTGRGQHLDISMIDSLFHAHDLNVQGPYITGGRWQPGRQGHRARVNGIQGLFKGPQGWVAVHVMQNQWPGMCRAMGMPELEHDPRFASLEGRQKNRHDMVAMIEAWMAAHDTDAAVLAKLNHERVPCAPVMNPADAINDPHFQARGMVREVPDPVLGATLAIGSPLRFSEQPEPLDLSAPLLGEHNRHVLAGLGFSNEAIADLEARGLLATANT